MPGAAFRTCRRGRHALLLQIPRPHDGAEQRVHVAVLPLRIRGSSLHAVECAVYGRSVFSWRRVVSHCRTSLQFCALAETTYLADLRLVKRWGIVFWPVSHCRNSLRLAVFFVRRVSISAVRHRP